MTRLIFDLPVHKTDVLEHVIQHGALVLTDRPLPCRLELISLVPQSATGELLRSRATRLQYPSAGYRVDRALQPAGRRGCRFRSVLV